MRPSLASALILALLPLHAIAQEPTGAVLYKDLCARCHGPAGEGTKKYPTTLVGELTPTGLVRKISGTMPEDNPAKLDAAGAKKVAEFMHQAFYSPDAQARRNPPRIELSHLTVGQYRNAIADVIAGFRKTPTADARQGLMGDYSPARGFRGGRPRGNNEVRLDPEVRFDFGTIGPKSDKLKYDPFFFSITWDGSVIAPETGHYDFVVNTQHGARLFVNDFKQPALDASVKSGTGTEFRASLFLIGGRAYPLRLEFAKGLRSGDDVQTEKNKNKLPAEATVTLQWKRPGGADEVIPTRYLSPIQAPEVAVIHTPFPPDDRSLGWERGTGVAKEWDDATTEAAFEAAGYVVARLSELSGIADDASDRDQKLRDFCKKFAERAFRRPLTADETKSYIDRQFAATTDPNAGVKRVVLFVLKSPRFWYPELASGSESFAVAGRLALALWDAPPDQKLLDAAASGKLATREEVAKQAERMLDDPRARAKTRQFLLTWLKVDQPHELVKDATRFPGFDAAVAADLRTSLELSLDEVVWSAKSDFRQLLQGDETFLNGRLAKFYGADLPADAVFQKVKLDAGKRAGVLTHPYTLATLSYSAESSPIHRGVFVARGLLGVTLRPPPEAFTPEPADRHPNLTNRQRVALQTKPAACARCHELVNPLGFALEGFDAVGRTRDKESGKPIDVSGHYDTREGTSVKFTGASELAGFLSRSDEVHAAFVQQLFHHLVKQPVRAYGLARPEELRRFFVQNEFSVRRLMVEIATIAAMTPPTPPKTP